jgi:Ca-activated chloride channel family protein
MRRCSMRRKIISLAIGIAAVCLMLVGPASGKLNHRTNSLAQEQTAPPAPPDRITQGTLRITDKDGKIVSECPLKHTDVRADISGFIARVTVTQEFLNPARDKIEAVYVFPLPQMAAVDDMTMKVGKRTIRGVVKKKEEARKIYEDAKRAGHVAALLDQERPNIFTQSVANIMPGETVKVVISYVETLKYEDGLYEFVFPMVVGPRYIPGEPAGQSGTGWAPDTDRVPDASRITPPVAPPGTRAGHDISVQVGVNAGVPIKKIRSVLHKVEIKSIEGSPRAQVSLADEDTIPNKDFILQYETAGSAVEDAVLTHATAKDGGFFTLILQPPDRPRQNQIAPKEMIFVIDTSGSQQGWPVEKAKETMKYCIENMNKDDTFQLLAFSNDVISLFDEPRPNTRDNREKALKFLSERLGSGGTEMMKAIMAALEPEKDPKRLRVVCFMTDGYVGNDMEIIEAVKKNLGGARLFSFGVGNSTNRYLLEKMAQMGRGAVEYVTLNRHGDEVAEKFYERIANPLLTNIEAGFGDAPVSDVYPEEIPDLFSSRPLIIMGRYSGSWKGEIAVTGSFAGKSVTRKIKADFPQVNEKNDVLASLWARTRIEDLMDRDLTGIQRGKPEAGIKNAITELGLKFRLMTQFTSFVAVEEKTVTEGGVPRTVAVPVEIPDGVSYEGIFGELKAGEASSSGSGGSPGRSVQMLMAPPPAAAPMNAMTMKASGPYASRMKDEFIRETAPALKPKDKLSPALLNLEEKVRKEGKDGTLVLKDVKVNQWELKIIVTLDYVSSALLKKITRAGLAIETFSGGEKILTGRMDIRKLMDLAEIEGVRKIEPLVK